MEMKIWAELVDGILARRERFVVRHDMEQSQIRISA